MLLFVQACDAEILAGLQRCFATLVPFWVKLPQRRARIGSSDFAAPLSCGIACCKHRPITFS